MEPLKKGTLVLSLAGRDKGTLLAAAGSDAQYVLVCDGKERPVERPKRKNLRHLRVLDERIEEDALVSNRALRKALKAKQSAAETQED